ncbi:uncharacterized protein J3D65DRAFT_625382 [Phyllosticta citribraziliensis]|uniref:Uncharacterized protein n=1 Tax=Phyllosticta citribraziliensis TaxID=989973 RepID=A0ABR1LQE5_9PEZI
MTISTPKPTPATLTLRLKFHRTTVLLHADPLLSSSALQSDLLHALRDTHPSNILHGRPLPASPGALQIARLVDPTDAEQGWVEIIGSSENDDIDAEDEEEAPRKKGPGRPSTGKGKGKGAATSSSAIGGAGKSLKELGVKEGMALAFRWAGEVQRDGEVEVLEWEDWDVQWPRYEDTYGLEDEGIVE